MGARKVNKGTASGTSSSARNALRSVRQRDDDAMPQTAAEDEDWLGAAGGDEEDALAIRGDSDSEDFDADDDDEDEDEDDAEDDDEEDGDAPPDFGDRTSEPAKISKVLAKVASGEMPTDMHTIKQRIHDDVTLLSNWRKAKELGDKRTRAEVFQTLVGNCSMYFGYAEELAEYFLQMFSPEQAIKFFEANEQQRPLTIRTNSLKARRTTLMEALTTRKVSVDPIGAWTKVGLKVYDAAVPVGATPEYLGGHYMIQSASSLVPVMALAPQQDEVILDMAAAPGGKTTYIGQLMRNTGTLFANDLRKERCKSLVANCHRMGLTNVVVTNLDGRKLSGMLPRLDRVLLDAPCSGSGIIARDPSVKVKRGTKDFEETSRLQKELLNTAIDMVDAKSKTGGYIVYSTCSVSVEENEAVVEHALRTRNVELVSFSSSVNFGVEGLSKYRERRFHPGMTHCRRYYPHVHNMDGFFVAKLKKTSNDIPERIKKDRTKGAENIKTWGEEHWTEEMMNSVKDYTEVAPVSIDPSIGKSGKPLNKIERKKLKRAKILAERAAAAQAVAAKDADDGSKKAKRKAAEVEEKVDEEPEAKRPLKKKKKKMAA